MKKILLVFMTACIMHSIAGAQLKIPAPSPPQNIKQDFGISGIELSYSRPGVKGRKIFGDLIPFGKVWRTGANDATTITFGDEVTIGGKKIPAGKYGLLTIPNESKWTIIISKQTDVTNASAYKQDMDVARFDANTRSTPVPIETLTMQFFNVKSNSCELYILWENTAVSIPITTDVDSKVMAQINTAMSTDKPPYFAAASYYFDNGKDLNKAKEWAQKATEADPKAYYVFYLLARIQAKSGEKANAIATANKAIGLAKEARNDDYVKLNEKLIADLK